MVEEGTVEDFIKPCSDYFDQKIYDSLFEFVKIPNVSPDYDPTWETNGLAQKACDHIVNWIKAQVYPYIYIYIFIYIYIYIGNPRAQTRSNQRAR